MSIKSQLAKIVKTLTGSDSTAKSTAGILGEINDAVSNGSGGASAPFVVVFDVSYDGQTYQLSTTTTGEELLNAFDNGRTIWASVLSREFDEQTYAPMTFIKIDNDRTYIEAVCRSEMGGTNMVTVFMSSDESLQDPLVCNFADQSSNDTSMPE